MEKRQSSSLEPRAPRLSEVEFVGAGARSPRRYIEINDQSRNASWNQRDAFSLAATITKTNGTIGEVGRRAQEVTSKAGMLRAINDMHFSRAACYHQGKRE
jgi:hypothetical protein